MKTAVETRDFLSVIEQQSTLGNIINNYLRIHWTDLYNFSPNGLYEYELSLPLFSDFSRDIAITTDFMAKFG